MTRKLEIYKCEICRNTVEVLIEGYGQLVCCGQNMTHLEEQTEADEMLGEKHVPVITKTETGLEIKVGTILHPMLSEHYIMLIELYSKDMRFVKRKYLYPGEEPLLNFKCASAEYIIARELCNIHGLWTSRKDLGE